MAKKSNEKKSEKPIFKAEGMKVANVRRLSDTVVAFSLLGAGLGLYGLKVIDGSKGKFIATPSQKGKDGKYYDVICGRRLKAGEEKQVYTDAELEFGKENLATLPAAFVERTKKQCKDIERFLAVESLQEESRAELLERKARLEGVIGK